MLGTWQVTVVLLDLNNQNITPKAYASLGRVGRAVGGVRNLASERRATHTILALSIVTEDVNTLEGQVWFQ